MDRFLLCCCCFNHTHFFMNFSKTSYSAKVLDALAFAPYYLGASTRYIIITGPWSGPQVHLFGALQNHSPKPLLSDLYGP